MKIQNQYFQKVRDLINQIHHLKIIVDVTLNLVQTCEELLHQKLSKNGTWNKLSYLTTYLKEMQSLINKDMFEKKLNELVSTE